MLFAVYGGRSSWPFRWREPMQTQKRCPRCQARLIVTAAEDRCPYCGYSKYKVIAPLDRTPSGIDMSLRNQIEDAVEGATDEYGRPAEHFVSYDPPRQLNGERVMLVGMMWMFFYICSEFWDLNQHARRHLATGQYAGPFVLLTYVVPSLLYLITMFTTFLTLKPLTIAAGIASAIGGAVVLCDPGLSGPLLALPADWTTQVVGSYLVISGLWASSIAWRDWRILRTG
jgi:hypothetical protein